MQKTSKDVGAAVPGGSHFGHRDHVRPITDWKRPGTAAATFFLLCVFTLWLQPGFTQDAPPQRQRIISSAPVVTEILFAIGAGDEVVGVDDFSKYPPEAAKIKSIGALRNLNTETLIALQPTLVVIYGQNPDLETFCKQRQVAKVNVMCDSVDDIFKTIETLGEATGHETGVKKLGTPMRNRLFLMGARAADQPAQRVLITVGREAGSFQNVLTIGSGSFLDELVTTAGGKNVFHDIEQPYPMISSEQIIAAAPDVIIEMSGEGGEMKDIEQRKKDWQVFKSVPAVKNGRIHFLSGDYLLIPGPRIGKTAEDLLRVLHPDSGGK